MHRKRINRPCIAPWDLDSPRAWNVSLGMGAEELEQQCIVGFDPCLRKAMTTMVELDKTRICNFLGNELAQLPRNEEIIRGSNQQRRVADTPQALSGVISEQRVDACRRDFLWRVPGRAAPSAKAPWTRTIVLTAAYAGDDAARAAPARRARIKRFMVKLRQCAPSPLHSRHRPASANGQAVDCPAYRVLLQSDRALFCTVAERTTFLRSFQSRHRSCASRQKAWGLRPALGEDRP